MKKEIEGIGVFIIGCSNHNTECNHCTLIIKETLIEMNFINYVKDLLLARSKLKLDFYFCLLYNTNIVK